MKKLALVLALAPFAGSASSPAAAQVVAARGAVAPDACPCTDYRFAPKTDKAKAVAAFWDARRKYKVAAGVGSMALFFTLITRQPTGALNDAQRSVGLAQDELLRTRDRAVQLGGLRVQGDGGVESPVVVALKPGVDYDLKDPR